MMLTDPNLRPVSLLKSPWVTFYGNTSVVQSVQNYVPTSHVCTFSPMFRCLLVFPILLRPGDMLRLIVLSRVCVPSLIDFRGSSFENRDKRGRHKHSSHWCGGINVVTNFDYKGKVRVGVLDSIGLTYWH